MQHYCKQYDLGKEITEEIKWTISLKEGLQIHSVW